LKKTNEESRQSARLANLDHLSTSKRRLPETISTSSSPTSTPTLKRKDPTPITSSPSQSINIEYDLQPEKRQKTADVNEDFFKKIDKLEKKMDAIEKRMDKIEMKLRFNSLKPLFNNSF